MSPWKCDTCGLINSFNRNNCQACFRDIPESYDDIINANNIRYGDEVVLRKIISGYLTNLLNPEIDYRFLISIIFMFYYQEHVM